MNTQTGNSFTAANPRKLECVCTSEYQDKRYGKYMRLHNPCKDNKFRCTVCGRTTERT